MWGRVKSAVYLFVVLAIVAVALGHVIGQPVLLSYVISDSMEPTISEGDGYLVVPAALSGPPEEGDIIVFESKTLENDGGLTTHRVAERTDEGYVTKGDANPFTDQSNDEPPVKEAQIVGKAVQIGDDPIVIPHLGSALGLIRGGVQNTQRTLATTFGIRSLQGSNGLAYLLFGVGCLLFVGSTVTERRNGPKARRSRNRRTGLFPRGIPTWIVAATLAGVLITSLTMTMVLAGGTHEFGVVSAESPSQSPTVIESGGSDTIEYTVPNDGVLPIVAYVDPASKGVETPDKQLRVGPGDRETVVVELSVPESTGYYNRYVTEYRYIRILPQSVIHALYRLHPWLPILVIDVLVFSLVFAGTLAIIGRGRIRPRSRRSLFQRIKRSFG
ncbi:signal peptidase I [Natrinema halophilum]|uniref:Signal peptidase I n=1 Tax=Natrinema halophilum TaxID=1699371 RepID=A0A7D5H973_9EURY|nr:signal peptidase I [Natrinema halophilum]QLG50075.1 signal peptidase I [Natrinema halophilum]